MECTVTWTGAAGTRSGMGFLAKKPIPERVPAAPVQVTVHSMNFFLQ